METADKFLAEYTVNVRLAGSSKLSGIPVTVLATTKAEAIERSIDLACDPESYDAEVTIVKITTILHPELLIYELKEHERTYFNEHGKYR